jgi:DNA-binding transcriptional regulator YiaG
MAERLRTAGCDWPELVASTLEVRGRTGLDREDFAATIGLRTEQVADVEAGRVAPDEVPEHLLCLLALLEPSRSPTA